MTTVYLMIKHDLYDNMGFEIAIIHVIVEGVQCNLQTQVHEKYIV